MKKRKTAKDRQIETLKTEISFQREGLKVAWEAVEARNQALKKSELEIQRLEGVLKERTYAGNKMAVAAAELIRDSEALEKNREQCAELARIYGLALTQMIKFSIPVIDSPDRRDDEAPKPEQQAPPEKFDRDAIHERKG